MASDREHLGAATARFEGHRLGEPGYRRISVALFAAGLATFALLYCTQPLLPELAGSFDVSAAASTLTVSLCTAALGLSMLLAGPASEVLGRTGLMRWSLVAAVVVGLLCAAAPSWPVLLGLRAAQGVTLAGLPAIAIAYLREEVHPDSHAGASGLYIGGTALGGMTGRLIAGGLADLGGWRLALAGIGGLGLLCAVVVIALLPPSRNFTPAPADARRIARMTLRVLGDPVLVALYAVAAVLMGAFVAVYNAVGFRLTGPPFQLSIAVAGLVFCVYPIGTFSSAYAGRLADRFGRRPVEPVACVVMLAGVLLTLAPQLWLIVSGLAVMTAGFFAAHGVASGWVAARAQLGAGGTAQAASLYLFGYYLGSSVFGGVAGVAWSAGGWRWVVVETAALTLAGLALALGLYRSRSLHERGTTPPPVAY